MPFRPIKNPKIKVKTKLAKRIIINRYESKVKSETK
jgi:hypothetical protein